MRLGIPSHMHDLIDDCNKRRADGRRMNRMSVWTVSGRAGRDPVMARIVASDLDEAHDLAPRALDFATGCSGCTVNEITETLENVLVAPAGHIIHGDII